MKTKRRTRKSRAQRSGESARFTAKTSNVKESNAELHENILRFHRDLPHAMTTAPENYDSANGE